jgi:transposase
MQKLVIADARIMRLAIQEEIARSEESRYDHRLHGVLLVSQGLSASRVAEWFGQDSRTVARWVRRFETRGFAGLYEGERPGRPPRLSPRQVAAVDRALRQEPRTLGYAQTLWDGKLLAHHVAERYGVSLGVRQCQRLFHQLGFRQRKPRPVIAQADPAVQAAFKKTPPPRRRPWRGSLEPG